MANFSKFFYTFFLLLVFFAACFTGTPDSFELVNCGTWQSCERLQTNIHYVECRKLGYEYMLFWYQICFLGTDRF